MNLPHAGFDLNATYFEHNLNSTEIPNVFIHGVGLDNTMWLPQKKFFQNNQVVFYDLFNHGKSKKEFSLFKRNEFSNVIFFFKGISFTCHCDIRYGYTLEKSRNWITFDNLYTLSPGKEYFFNKGNFDKMRSHFIGDINLSDLPIKLLIK